MVDTASMRILDAALNRAGEGLRVIEDYVRFALDDPFLTRQCKDLRHDLAAIADQISPAERHAARDTCRDVGAAISRHSEASRCDDWDVCAASLKRTEQSLRSLEEYGKLIDVSIGRQIESLRYRTYTLEKTIDLGRSSRERLEGVRLCVLVDGCGSATEFERLVSQLVEAGVGMIQLRDKRLDDRELVARARSLVALTRRGLSPFAESAEQKGTVPLCATRTLVIINDRPDIAAAVHADGVHLGQEDLALKDARAIVGTRMLIGASTHYIDQARAAVLDGANYLGAGPTFASHTKTFDQLAGLDYLREVAAEIRLPTFAIGGINDTNLPNVLATGVTRIAVSGAVTSAGKPRTAARSLLNIFDRAVQSSTKSASLPQPPVPSP
jgi:thiamine-phosphate pyrophosphorylase